MIPHQGIIPVSDNDCGNAAGSGTKQISLQGQPVAVTAANLHGGFHSLCLQEHGSGQRAHPHHGIVHLTYDKSLHLIFDLFSTFDHCGNIASFGWFHLVTGICTLPASVIFGFLWKEFGAPAAFGVILAIGLLAAAILALSLRKPGGAVKGTV